MYRMGSDMRSKTIDYDKILSTSPFLAQWKSDIAKVLKNADKTLEDDEINEFLDEIIVEYLQFPEV